MSPSSVAPLSFEEVIGRRMAVRPHRVAHPSDLEPVRETRRVREDEVPPDDGRDRRCRRTYRLNMAQGSDDRTDQRASTRANPATPSQTVSENPLRRITRADI